MQCMGRPSSNKIRDDSIGAQKVPLDLMEAGKIGSQYNNAEQFLCQKCLIMALSTVPALVMRKKRHCNAWKTATTQLKGITAHHQLPSAFAGLSPVPRTLIFTMLCKKSNQNGAPRLTAKAVIRQPSKAMPEGKVAKKV